MKEKFTQKNDLVIEEGKVYTSIVGDMVKVEKIDIPENRMVCYNLSEKCRSWHRIDAAITDNKFSSQV